MTCRYKALGLAGAFCVLAAGASASSITLTYQGPSSAGDTKQVNITSVPSYSPALATGNQFAYGFKMTSGNPSPLDDFLAWCLDLQYFLGTNGQHQYEITNTPFNSTLDLSMGGRGDRIQAVFDANYGELDATDGAQAAGFQLALWEALYDNDLNLGTGAFQADDDTLGTAGGFLTAASDYGNGGKKFNLTFLESTGDPKKQNLVTATPVPLPAAGWLMIAGLGGLAALRRRKRAA